MGVKWWQKLYLLQKGEDKCEGVMLAGSLCNQRERAALFYLHFQSSIAEFSLSWVVYIYIADRRHDEERGNCGGIGAQDDAVSGF